MAYVNVPYTLSWEERGELCSKDQESSFKSVDGSEEENLSFSLAGSDFDFSARFSEADGGPPTPPMSTAEELFHNGKIRPLNRLYSFNSEQDSCSSNHADYESYYDHLMSADYDHDCRGFQSPRLPPQQQQMKQNLGLPKPTTCTSALEQWKKSMGRQHSTNTKANANAHYDEMRNMQACGGGHRRTRSLSPLRVFHMDDMIQPRPSFESEVYTNTAAAVDDVVGKCQCVSRPRRMRKSWTLKELLNMGDSRVHKSSLRCDSREKFGEHFGEGGQSTINFGGKLGKVEQSPLNVKRLEQLPLNVDRFGGKTTDTFGDKDHRLENLPLNVDRFKGKTIEKIGDKLSSKRTSNLENAGGKLGKKGVGELHSKSTPNMARFPLNQQALSAHGRHYASQSAQAEVMKKKTFLPYKHGLLDCLGFTSKSYSSMKGLHKLNPRSQ